MKVLKSYNYTRVLPRPYCFGPRHYTAFKMKRKSVGGGEMGGWPLIGKTPTDRLQPASTRFVTSISEVPPVSSWDLNCPSNCRWKWGIRSNSKNLSDTIRLHFGQHDWRKVSRQVGSPDRGRKKLKNVMV
jgi:hypothetical protein